jgi:hypothetical protein
VPGLPPVLRGGRAPPFTCPNCGVGGVPANVPRRRISETSEDLSCLAMRRSHPARRVRTHFVHRPRGARRTKPLRPGARNHLEANRSLEFCFEIQI